MTDSSSQLSKIAASYHEIDGIVWMKRNNHLAFTNSKYRQVNYGPFPTSVKPNMELDKGVQGPPRKDGAGEDSEQSSHEENYSDQDITLNDEDVWDDSFLIKMYEASQKQINDELTKRFTVKTCDSTNEEPNYSASVASTGNVADNFTSSSSSKTKKPKHIFSSKKVMPKATFDSKPVLSKPMNWKEGDYCQLTYLEDNVDYEATIISINTDQTCLVRYIGYENEEVRSLSDLKPSEGEKVRTLQIEMSIQDGYGKATAGAGLEEPTAIHLQATPPELLMLPKHLSQAGAGLTSGTSRIIPPPPPFLNGDSNLANNPSALLDDDDDDDVLASMLMSWYMTGYHTGYYQARKDMKNNNR